MKKALFGGYVVYQYEYDSEDNKTDKFFAIAIVLSEQLAKDIVRDNNVRFYEQENVIVQ